MIFVTHDQVEAMTLADRIVVMNNRKIEQIGTPMEIYRRPAHRVRRQLRRHAGDEFPAGDDCRADGGSAPAASADGTAIADRHPRASRLLAGGER